MPDGTTAKRYSDFKYGTDESNFRYFELKNYAHYTVSNITNVVKGLEKEMHRALAYATGGSAKAFTDAIDRIHFVFRGGPEGGGSDVASNEEEREAGDRDN